MASRPTGPMPAASLAGRFRLLRRIGVGGMGEIWVAEQLSLGRQVAVKMLAGHAASDPEASVRFEREAKSLSRVDHDHVVRVLDFGEDPDLGYFLATELLEGETLGSLLQRQGRLSIDRAVAVAAQILDGLGAVHALEVVHRDLKPDNVMLTLRDDGGVWVKLIDFGIVKLLDTQGLELTQTGLVFGTPGYLSPEQALARSVDHRSDLYACGVILYQMLVGKLPFDAPSPSALAILHATELPPPLPAELVPAPLAEVVARALEKDPDARWPDAQAMREALLGASSALPLRITLDVIRSPTVHLEPTLPKTRPMAAGPIPRTDRSATRTLLAARIPEPAKPPGRWEDLPAEHAADVVRRFGGRLISSGPTSLLGEMASPTDALLCAATLHDSIVQRFGAGEVEVQVGVAAGEVLRQGRKLVGQAVGQAGVLAEHAAPGEVLFSRAVYLSMIRSEVRSEPYRGPDPGVGQRTHRLLPFEGGPFLSLPFGGSWLQRGQPRGPRRLLRLGRKLAVAAWEGLWSWGNAGAASLAPAARWASERRKLSGGIALALVLGTAATLALTPPRIEDRIEAALAAGEHEVATALVDDWIRRDTSDGRAHAWKGRILLSAGELEEAKEMIQGALELDPALATDPGVARGMVRLLDARGADGGWVVRAASPAVEDALLEATRSVRYWQRWNAARVLERIGKGTEVDGVGLWLLDLQHAASCGTRLRAARELAKVGRGDARVLPALREAKARGFPHGACNLEQAVDESIAALRR